WRVGRCIETVDGGGSTPLAASPRDYCSIVGAQCRRWRISAQPGLIGEARKASSQSFIGGDTTANHQRISYGVFAAEQRDRIRGPIGHRLADRQLNRGGESRLAR